MSITDNLKRGTIELVLLTLLIEQDMYGYQLSHEMEQRSDSLFIIQEGSMYPTLYRMMDKGLISSRHELVGKRRVRVYYHIESSGIEYLKEIKKEYIMLNRGILKVMQMKSLEDQSDDGKL